MSAGERVDQRRLAGAVAADEGDDLAGVQVDRDAVDGVDAAERHADVAQLDERRPPSGCGDGLSVVVVSVMSMPSRHGPSGLDDERGDDEPGCEGAERDPPASEPQRGVDGHRGDEHDADHDVLRRRVDVEQHHAGAQRLHDDRTEHGAGDRADAAGERRAADDRGRDHVEFVLHAEVGGRSVESSGLDGGAHRARARPSGRT